MTVVRCITAGWFAMAVVTGNWPAAALLLVLGGYWAIVR